MLSADPERPERHGRLSTSELVHRGDVVALHRVWRSQRSPVCGGASAASTILGTCIVATRTKTLLLGGPPSRGGKSRRGRQNLRPPDLLGVSSGCYHKSEKLAGSAALSMRLLVAVVVLALASAQHANFRRMSSKGTAAPQLGGTRASGW